MSKNFEESMEKLQNLVSEMEKGNISLDESIDKFEEGMKLIKECRQALENARGRVEKVLENGNITAFEEVNND